MIQLKRTNSHDPDFLALIVLLDEYLAGVYGDLQLEYDRYNKMGLIDTVVLAYADGDPAGCACFKPFDEDATELKRMFVKPEYRGQGIASAIMNDLEQWALGLNYTSMVLETGVDQPEAISLYKKQGYQVIESYGQYADLESSVCMKKKI